jgi:signal peptidase I
MANRSNGKQRQSPLRVLVNVFLVLSTVLLVCSVVFFLVVRFSGQADRIFFLGYKPYFQTLETMSPEYERYSLVIVKQADYQEVKTGDVIAMLHRNDLGEIVPVFHRVIGEDDYGLITKGDNRAEIDPFRTSGDELVGVRVWHTNVTAKIYHFLSDPVHLTLTILVIVAVVGWLSYSILRRKPAADPKHRGRNGPEPHGNQPTSTGSQRKHKH